MMVNMIESDEKKLITCILSKGIALGIAVKLKETYSLRSFDIKSARGVGKITPLAYRGVGEQTEKEILTVSIPAELSDEIFEFIYDEAKINRPHGGLMYVYPLTQSTVYQLPDLPEEK